MGSTKIHNKFPVSGCQCWKCVNARKRGEADFGVKMHKAKLKTMYGSREVYYVAGR